MKARTISGQSVPTVPVQRERGHKPFHTRRTSAQSGRYNAFTVHEGGPLALNKKPGLQGLCKVVLIPSGKTGVMCRFGQFGRIVVSAFVLLAASGPALALDDKMVVQQPEKNPWAVFKFGFSAYKSGKKQEAVEAYRYAAEKGQVGASWKLARMYADGDGVKRNDYEAFRFFGAVAQLDVQPGSEDESYVSDALVAVARYLKVGIPGTSVYANPALAQEYFMRAAATYRHSGAQYELGMMLLTGDGGTRNVTQAARWLQLASEKGHVGAQAALGNLLFQSGQTVRGLALMTTALEHAAPKDMGWIRSMQEQAFALAAETDRRTAIALAEDYLKNGVR